MANAIALLVLIGVLAAAGGYVYKAKKHGRKCIGCPHSGECAARSCGCHQQQ